MAFWVLKPIKKSLFLTYYQDNSFSFMGWEFNAAQAEMFAKEVNVLVAGIAMMAFSMLASRFRREQIVYIVSGFCISCLLFFKFVLIPSDGSLSVWLFYLFGDLFVTVMVVAFFAFLNDSVDVSSARRQYGLVGFGGVLGGFSGSVVVAFGDRFLGPFDPLVLCIFIVVLIVLTAIAASHIFHSRLEGLHACFAGDAKSLPSPHASPLAGVQLVFQSKYLLSILYLVLLYETVSSILDFQFTSTILHYVSGPDLSVYFASVFSFTNFISLIVQLFVTGFILKRFGVAIALLVLPLMILCGSFGFLLMPVLLAGSLLNTVDNGFAYSINQSAKESLYVPTSREEKYQAKAFIDMFVQRFAKGLSIVISLVISMSFSDFDDLKWLSLVVVFLVALWFLAARYAGNHFIKLADENVESDKIATKNGRKSD